MEEIFIHDDSPNGTYRCIVESDTRSVWAYLHDIQNKTVLGAFPVCSISKLESHEKFKETYEGDGAPPLVEGFTSDEAVIPDIKNERIKIEWNDGKETVTVRIDEKPVSMMKYDESQGSSIYLKKEGPWGSPWNNQNKCEQVSGHNSGGCAPSA